MLIPYHHSIGIGFVVHACVSAHALRPQSGEPVKEYMAALVLDERLTDRRHQLSGSSDPAGVEKPFADRQLGNSAIVRDRCASKNQPESDPAAACSRSTELSQGREPTV